MSGIMTNFTAADMPDNQRKKAIPSNPPKAIKKEKIAKSVPAESVVEKTLEEETPKETKEISEE